MGRLRQPGSACHAHARRVTTVTLDRETPTRRAIRRHKARFARPSTGGADTRASSTPSRTPMSSSFARTARRRTMIRASATASDDDTRAQLGPMPEPRLVAALGNCALGCNIIGGRATHAGSLKTVLLAPHLDPRLSPTPSAIAKHVLAGGVRRARRDQPGCARGPRRCGRGRAHRYRRRAAAAPA